MPKPCPLSDQEIKEKVSELIVKGISQRKIARIIGCRQTRIRRIMYALGYQPRKAVRHKLWEPTVKIPSEEWKLGYLASMIDGEGSLSIANDGYQTCSIYIANTSRPLMDWLKQNFGGYVCTYKKKDAKDGLRVIGGL